MNKILRPYTYLLSVHVAALLLLSVIRLFFYIAVKEQITGDAAGNASWIYAAFLRGLWFDNVIACYITALSPIGHKRGNGSQFVEEQIYPNDKYLVRCILHIGLYGCCQQHPIFCLFQQTAQRLHLELG